MNITLENKTVAILLCTYEGGLYLQEQLESIAHQTHPHIDVYASDDGSSDSTLRILKEFQSSWSKGKFVICKGPQNGFLNNFMSLVFNADIKADYYCYADQDDIWEANKVENSIKQLARFGQSNPLLYCSRTCLVDEAANKIGYSPLFEKTPSFRNALVQSIGGGNTMTLNQEARNILMQTSTCEFISHDWWTYILVSGAGGQVVYDAYPSVKYRQHAQNIIGGNMSWKARLFRIKMLFAGRFQQWNDVHMQSLEQIRHLLTEANQKTLDDFMQARTNPLYKRLFYFLRSRVYRQTLFGNLGLWVALLMKKL
ncbi:MAG: glycosyltransferase family 2 protein [Thiopseudomonas sp.]|nr:glycosyltransferase family 2 protein [Thiopseudomonas sp.]MCK9464757.1 glycosyltransferase family 2 protein [Thiopseudomonas sp.]